MTTKARRLRLTLLGVLILVAGLIGAVAIYVTAGDETDDVLAYEFVDGVAYPVQASAAKAYRGDLERFGGKAAVFADELRRGWSALWHGKPLAYGVAVLAAALAFFCFRAAHRLPDDAASDEGGAGNEGEEGGKRRDRV